jgi:molecular chaperone HscB
MMTFFERLGLPRRFSIHTSDVERLYLAKSRESHPDFHQLASAEDQLRSLEDTATLNQAYVTLRDPFRRADYLLTLLDGPSAQHDKNLDQSFLMEMMELREQIEDVQATNGDLAPVEADLVARLAQKEQAIAHQFSTMEAAPEANHSAQLVSIRRELNAVKTLQSLLRDVRNP